MRAVKFVGNGRAEVVDVAKPEGDREPIIVKVRVSAICGSDLASYFSPQGSKFIPGHEIAGEVVKVGNQATRLRPRDRVAINCMVGCGVCKFCRRGDWALCNQLKIVGGDMDGGHADYVAVPERNCFLLPSDLSFEQGALIGDGVGTPYRAIKRLGVSGTHIVALFGLGPVGLGALLILKFLNSIVIAVETSEYRRQMGRSLGADVVIDPNSQDPVDIVKQYTKGEGADVAIDYVGKGVTQSQALDCVKKGGKIAFGGVNKQAAIENIDRFVFKELTTTGSFYYNVAEYEEIVNLIRRGLGVEKIITHRFKIEEAPQAFSIFADGESGKVILVPKTIKEEDYYAD